MSNQLIIDFPDMPWELEKHFLEHKDDIKAYLWKGGERVKIPLEWNGSRICCPVTMWFDLPEGISIKSNAESETK